MFGISFTELLLIVFIGLIVLGPQKIPEAVKFKSEVSESAKF